MRSQPRLDWASFQRLDNAFVVDFLTAAAGALSESGELDGKDIDSLRVSLAGTQEIAIEQGGPILGHMDRSQSDFLARLVTRFGRVGLCQILWRRSLSKSVEESLTILRDWAGQAARRAEAVFNRPLLIYSGATCERQVLYSEAVCQFAEFLGSAAEDLRVLREALIQMPPSDTASFEPSEQAIDAAIAQATGFAGVDQLPHSHATEHRQLRRLTSTLMDVTEVLADLLFQLERNKVRRNLSEATSVADWLRLEIQQASAVSLPKDDNIEAWELRRQRLMASMSGINQCLTSLSELVGSQMGVPEEVDPMSVPFPQSVTRTLSQDLMRRGVMPTHAVAAASALVDYCRSNRIKASEIIPAELTKIHPHLVLSTLELFRSMDKDRGPIAVGEGRKKLILERLRFLHSTLGGMGPAILGVMLALGISLISCGVKKNPKSDVADIRPSIPFRVAEPLFDETPEENKSNGSQR